jgi:hypothetical protein
MQFVILYDFVEGRAPDGSVHQSLLNAEAEERGTTARPGAWEDAMAHCRNGGSQYKRGSLPCSRAIHGSCVIVSGACADGY